MTEALESIKKQERKKMDGAIDHLSKELQKIRTGKATPAMLDGLMVSYYGTPTPLQQVSNVTTPDSKTLAIQPWEKSVLGDIERAIFEANLGLTPMNDGEFIRITLPPLTQERRKELAKQSRSLGEDAKISIRNARRDIMDGIKAAVKDGMAEDEGKREEAEADKLAHQYTDKVDKIVSKKEEDLMTL